MEQSFLLGKHFNSCYKQEMMFVTSFEPLKIGEAYQPDNRFRIHKLQTVFWNLNNYLSCVLIPDEAKIGIGPMSSDKVIVVSSEETNKSMIWNNQEFYQYAVQQFNEWFPRINLIKFLPVDKMTYDLCFNSVKADYRLLKYVPVVHQNTEICKMALSIDPFAIRFVHHQTPDICKFAIQKNPYVIQEIKDQTEELCELALSLDPFVLQNIRDQPKQLCEKLIRQNPNLIKCVHNQTPDLCQLAVSLRSFVISHIRFPNETLCKLAVRKNPTSLCAIPPALVTTELMDIAST